MKHIVLCILAFIIMFFLSSFFMKKQLLSKLKRRDFLFAQRKQNSFYGFTKMSPSPKKRETFLTCMEILRPRVLKYSNNQSSNNRLCSGGSRGRPLHAPPVVQHFLNFMQFFGKFGKVVCWHPPPHPEGWRPLLRENGISHLISEMA